MEETHSIQDAKLSSISDQFESLASEVSCVTSEIGVYIRNELKDADALASRVSNIESRIKSLQSSVSRVQDSTLRMERIILQSVPDADESQPEQSQNSILDLVEVDDDLDDLPEDVGATQDSAMLTDLDEQAGPETQEQASQESPIMDTE